MRDGLRITERYRPAAGEINFTEDAHVLIRRHGAPIDPGPAEIIGLLREDFNGQSIQSCARRVADVQLMQAKCAGYLIGSGNLLTIEPDVRPKVDAIQMQPNVSITIAGRQAKFSSIPPGNAEGTVFRHRPQREVCADWITATRHQS